MKRTSAVLSFAVVSCLMIAASAVADQPGPKRTHTIASYTCGPDGCSPQEFAAAPYGCSTGQCSHTHSATTRSAPLSPGAPSQRLRSNANLSSVQTPTIMWQRDLRKAGQLAKAKGKPLMVNVSAEWCHYCVRMKAETYTQSPMIDQINRHYIPVMLDADANRNIVEMLGIESLPAVVVISNDATVLSKTTGYKSAAELSKYLDRFRVANKSERTHPASRNRW